MIIMKAGDKVHIEGYDGTGEILSVKGNQAEVSMGIMKMKVKTTQLTLASDQSEEENTSSSIAYSGIDTREKMMHFQYELDVRGKMKDEVLVLLTQWVDDAILLGVTEAKIIHGKGNGILRETVRSFLRKYKEIEKAANDPSGWGDGVTVVTFRDQ